MADMLGRWRNGPALKKFLNYEFLNRTFALFCFAAVPALGSAVSFVWHGGALWCVIEVLSGRRKLSRDHAMVVMTFLLLLYCLANVLSTLWNMPTYGGVDKLLRLGTLLLFPFSYSVWAISDKAAMARTVVLASMIACYTGLAFAAVQVHFLGLRAEGGAGNAIIFAFAISLAGSVSLAGLFSQDRSLALPLAGAFLAGWIALLYSGTRFLWITTLPVNLMVLWIYRQQLYRFISAKTLPLVALGLIVAVIAGAQIVSVRMHNLAIDWSLVVSDKYGTSFGARLSLLEMGLKLVMHHPFVGYGLGATKQLIQSGFKEKFDLDYSFSHFHNGYLTTVVEAGLFGAVSLVAIFVAAATNAARTLSRSIDPTEIFGAAMLLILVATYAIAALANKVLGHDIQDTIFVMFLIVGTYLASGTSLLTESSQIESVPKSQATPGVPA